MRYCCSAGVRVVVLNAADMRLCGGVGPQVSLRWFWTHKVVTYLLFFFFLFSNFSSLAGTHLNMEKS